MSNLAKRLITFCIGLPLIIVIVLVKPFHHAALQLIIAVASVIGISEYYNMSSSKIKLFPKWLLIIFSVLLPVSTFIFLQTELPLELILWTYTLMVIILMAIECLTAQDFTDSVPKIALSALGLFYVGYMLTFIQRITDFTYDTRALILFFLLVFMCDSGAWFFGILLGKNNRGIFKASPNKSVAGFIGGIFTDVGLTTIFFFVIPNFFDASIWRYLVIAFFTALASIIGDLIESVIKRSFGAKDSGRIIPGRGGILDCIDSVVAAAPVFYILYALLIENLL